MKKMFSLFLVIFLLMAVLSGCGGSDRASEQNDHNATDDASTIQTNEADEAAQFLAEVMAEIRAEAERQGVDPDEAIALWKAKLTASAVNSLASLVRPNNGSESPTTVVFHDNLPKVTRPKDVQESEASTDREETTERPDTVTDQEFLDEMIAAVKEAAEEAGFDPDKAVAQLEDRNNTYEMDCAVRDQDVKRLNYFFGKVVEEPTTSVTSNGEHACEMIVKPLAAITEMETVPMKMQIHTYQRYCDLGIETSDLVMFHIQDASTGSVIAGNKAMVSAYVCFIVK